MPILKDAAPARPGNRQQTQVLILGGGFAGLHAALEFEKHREVGESVAVMLINHENFSLFTPMLHEVAASDLDLTHIVNPFHKLLKRVRFFDGKVVSIDLPGKRITAAHGELHHHHELQYDHLIIALGSVTNFYNLPGLQEQSLTMKSLGDAIYLRNHIIRNLEEADFECSAGSRDSLLTFVVAGGGFAGVETIAALNDFVREAIKFYRHLDERLLRVVLVHPGAVILPELGEDLGRYAQQKLAERKVEILLNTKVVEASAQTVKLGDSTVIPTNTLVWTAGVSPNPLIATLPLEKERGRIAANHDLSVAGWPGVWALGDCASIHDPRDGKAYPPTAQHALREGRVVAQNVLATLRGAPTRAFVHANIGQLAAIGRRTGVAKILGLKFSGFLAWWLWRSIYLSKLPRFNRKVRVALDWSLDILFSKDLVQFSTQPGDAISESEHQEQPPQRGSGGIAA